MTNSGKGATGERGNQMRIAQVAPLAEAVPPLLYGGAERVVSFLTEELVAMGHEVTLFANADSRTSAELAPMWPHALRTDPDLRDGFAPHMLMLERVCRRAHEFDIIHSHLDYWGFSLLQRQLTPSLTTLHGRLNLPELRPVYGSFPDIPLVSISDAQRLPLPKLNYVATIPHGLPEALHMPRSVTPRYLAFLGRMSPEKGPDRAIRIARQVDIPLKMAAKVDRVDEPYFRDVIAPMIDGTSVEFVGEINDHEKSDFLGAAIVLLVPISWPEPFGLVMIEAMACGTPVVVFNQGSANEIIAPGVTGFVVNDEAEAVVAVPRAGQLSRTAIRRCFEQRFTARRMAEDYLTIYGRLRSLSHRQRFVGSWPELMTWWRGDPAEDNHLSCLRVDAEGSCSSDLPGGKL